MVSGLSEGLKSTSDSKNAAQSKSDSKSANENQSQSWSMSMPSTSIRPDDTLHQRVRRFVASTKLQTTNSTDQDFNENLQLCHEAMGLGVHPIRIPAGSSGSYFVRDIDGNYIAIFKPKDEEPFAPLNPKWPKFFQRILCFCCFGRACLIPNHGYLSETGASLVDEKLQLFIVPKTRVVKLASPSFFYSRIRSNTIEPRPKVGSYQLFMDGFRAASNFVPEWSRDDESCPLSPDEAKRFKFLFQKMCVLDYVIRNTDRHMDNWLIKYIPHQALDIAAIDNGLAFPIKHPETSSRLRQFPFGWSHLSWAKLPWDEYLRSHLLNILSPRFVQELCDDVKTLFSYDKENNRFLKYSQLRVLRGQIWNLRLALLANEPPAVMVKRPQLLISRRYRTRPPTSDWMKSFRVKPADTNGRRCC